MATSKQPFIIAFCNVYALVHCLLLVTHSWRLKEERVVLVVGCIRYEYVRDYDCVTKLPDVRGIKFMNK